MVNGTVYDVFVYRPKLKYDINTVRVKNFTNHRNPRSRKLTAVFISSVFRGMRLRLSPGVKKEKKNAHTSRPMASLTYTSFTFLV